MQQFFRKLLKKEEKKQVELKNEIKLEESVVAEEKEAELAPKKAVKITHLPLQDLPVAIGSTMGSFLQPEDLGKLKRVSKTYNRFFQEAQDNTLGELLVRHHFAAADAILERRPGLLFKEFEASGYWEGQKLFIGRPLELVAGANSPAGCEMVIKHLNRIDPDDYPNYISKEAQYAKQFPKEIEEKDDEHGHYWLQKDLEALRTITAAITQARHNLALCTPALESFCNQLKSFRIIRRGKHADEALFIEALNLLYHHYIVVAAPNDWNGGQYDYFCVHVLGNIMQNSVSADFASNLCQGLYYLCMRGKKNEEPHFSFKLREQHNGCDVYFFVGSRPNPDLGGSFCIDIYGRPAGQAMVVGRRIVACLMGVSLAGLRRGVVAVVENFCRAKTSKVREQLLGRINCSEQECQQSEQYVMQ